MKKNVPNSFKPLPKLFQIFAKYRMNHENLSKTVKISPVWQNFAISGHTETVAGISP